MNSGILARLGEYRVGCPFGSTGSGGRPVGFTHVSLKKCEYVLLISAIDCTASFGQLVERNLRVRLRDTPGASHVTPSSSYAALAHVANLEMAESSDWVSWRLIDRIASRLDAELDPTGSWYVVPRAHFACYPWHTGDTNANPTACALVQVCKTARMRLARTNVSWRCHRRSHDVSQRVQRSLRSSRHEWTRRSFETHGALAWEQDSESPDSDDPTSATNTEAQAARLLDTLLRCFRNNNHWSNLGSATSQASCSSELAKGFALHKGMVPQLICVFTCQLSSIVVPHRDVDIDV